MKKIILLILAALLAASSFVSCGNSETTAPETQALETAAPETAAPETVAPETAAPETAAPETAAPETAAPETAAPETAAPETVAPETAAPETVAPETAAPETAAPETAAPETAAPETVAPETAAPETVAPETAAPETVAPETAVPETVAPETAAPETVAPETAAPETAAPETAAPETAAPETVAPETAAPETTQQIMFEYFYPAEAFNAEALTIRFKKNVLCASQYEENGEGADVSYKSWVATTNLKLENCYGIYYNLAAHKKLMSVAFYDADGNYISGVGTNSMNAYATSVSGFVVCPENAVRVRYLGYLGSDVLPEFEQSTVLCFSTKEDFDAARGMCHFEGLKIACLGDSLTEGDYGPITSYGGRKFECYPYYLSLLTGASVTNFGRCGANATTYLNDYYNAGQIDITDSDIILLMLGTNKGLAEGSEYYRDYETLVDKILADKKPEAILVLIAPPSATTDPSKINYGYMDSITSANQTVRSLAEKKGLIFFDALSTSPIQPETEDLYQSFDGLHMNAEGYAVFAKYIAEELARILG